MNPTPHSDKLYRLHSAINVFLWISDLPPKSLIALEDADELMNIHLNNEAAGIAPPADLHGRVIRDIHAALPPELMGEILAKMPRPDRRMVKDALAERTVRRAIPHNLQPPTDP